ncbi:hypothetical protein [Nocardia sp. NPDC004860]|uniref:hypothetical protein n=1 Tax=Nocardia sp. NPDC004860 TaxID=3154557 RepID=UPI0033AF8507
MNERVDLPSIQVRWSNTESTSSQLYPGLTHRSPCSSLAAAGGRTDALLRADPPAGPPGK